MLADLKHRLLAIAAVGAVLYLLAAWLRGPEPADALAPGEQTFAKAAAGEASAAGMVALPPNALVEVDVLGQKLDAARLFDLGFAGGISVDQETRASLEKLLAGMDDEPSARDIENLEATLRAGLPNEDAEQAIEIFHGYRAYRAELKDVGPKLGTPETPEEANGYFDRLVQIQLRHFDEATAKALFGQDNLNARLVMQAAFISQNDTLSTSEKSAQFELLRAQLPAESRELIPELAPGKP